MVKLYLFKFITLMENMMTIDYRTYNSYVQIVILKLIHLPEKDNVVLNKANALNA